MDKKEILGTKWYSIFDWPLILLVIGISMFGVLVIYSATFTSESDYLRNLYMRQIEWNFYGLLLLVTLTIIDYRVLERPAYLIYIIAIVVLLYVLMSGRVISGSQRWLTLGGMNIQPSEIVKIVLIITLTRYFDDRSGGQSLGFKELIIPAFIVLIPVALIAKQPDLGTASVIIFITVVMTFVNGIRRKTLTTIVIGLLVMIPVFWSNLKAYQKDRILALYNPESDPLGIGYHTIQSKIAIGSGGLFGKGFFAGTQSKLNFLPEKHTDFIFAVFAEEAGFMGTLIFLSLFLILLLIMIGVISKANDRTGALIAAGVTAMFAYHFFYNVGMTLGLLPIIGIPLPFLSYGGSALLAGYAGIGLLLSIHLRRFRRD